MNTSGAFLELVTGTGLSTAWILVGVDASSTLLSVDNEEAVQSIPVSHLFTLRQYVKANLPKELTMLSVKGRFDDGVARPVQPVEGYVQEEVIIKFLRDVD